MLSPEVEQWRRVKIHAAAQDFKSPQKFVEYIVDEWLETHPLLMDVDSINQNKSGGKK